MSGVPASSNPVAAVDSVFTRTGAVVAAAGDYTPAQVGATGSDGWVLSADTWVYASASTFTIAGVDRTTVYTPGTRLRCTNSGTKYLIVVSSAFSTNTTVTVTGGTDYTLANAAITVPSYSYDVNPQGYPGWFNYAITWAGFSADPVVLTSRFAVVGRMVSIYIILTSNGTSNATTLTLSAPLPAAVTQAYTLMRGVDNGTAQTAPAYLSITGAASTFSAFKDLTGAAWTGSGSKSVQGFFSYAA